MLNLYELLEKEEIIAKNIFTTVLRSHNIHFEDISVDITMVDKDEIHQLNIATRQVDKPTDVLSFPSVEIGLEFNIKDYEEERSPEDGTLYLGEIIICRDIMCEQAIEYGHSSDRECAFLITHGMLHLLGYDHIIEEERSLMRSKEDEILEQSKYFR